MGYSVPAGVAAQIAKPRQQVISFVGDGGFMMTGQELSTALQHDAKPIILLFNNSMYGTIRMHQERYYPERIIGTDLVNPDFKAVALAYGAHGERVTKTEEFEPALTRALSAQKAALIELITDPEQITTRTTISKLRANSRANKSA
jgi:acetolactate synthase-1/2/3 large subunit